VAQDIEGAKVLLYTLLILSFYWENVIECVTEARRLVKIIQSGYALQISTGSMLLNKFTSKSSELFNHSVHNLQNKVKRMEREYKLTDPKATLKVLASPLPYKYLKA